MRHVFLFSASVLALSCALPASAQDNDEAIIVTATRAAAPIQRLPADIDVIDADTAQSQGLVSIGDALSTVPGLDVVASGGVGQQTSLFSSGAHSNHTLVLFDGIRINDVASPGSAFDAGQDTLGALQRIEVVQGPMSAVFGSDAIGGVVNILPRRGGEGAFNMRFDAAAGTLGSISGAAGADGHLGGFGYAVTLEGFATEGVDLVPQRMSTHTGDKDSAESTTLTGLFDWDVSAAFALDLLLRRREARADYDAFLYTPNFEEFRADDPDLELAKNDLDIARLGATWRMTETVSLRASGGRVRQERLETDGGALLSSYDGRRDFADLTLDWESGDIAGLINTHIVTGLEAQNEEVDTDQGFAAVVASQEHRGAFVTAQGDVARFTLTAAARADDFEGFGAQGTWRLGASYALSDTARVYAVYGTSFRAPTLYERFISFGDPDLDPEKGSAWEIGGDASFSAFAREDGAELGLVYRSLDIEDLIDFGPAFTYVNIDEAEIETIEARVALRPLSWLTARAAYVHTDAADAASGDALLRRPEETWSASLEIEHGAWSGLLSWRQVGERADQIYGDDGIWRGVGVAHAYDVLRASAAWSFADDAQIYVAIDNVTDEDYEPANAFAGAQRNAVIGVRLRP